MTVRARLPEAIPIHNEDIEFAKKADVLPAKSRNCLPATSARIGGTASISIEPLSMRRISPNQIGKLRSRFCARPWGPEVNATVSTQSGRSGPKAKAVCGCAGIFSTALCKYYWSRFAQGPNDCTSAFAEILARGIASASRQLLISRITGQLESQ